MEFETKGKQQVNVYYVNAPVFCVVEENFGGNSHDYDVSALQAQVGSNCVFYFFYFYFYVDVVSLKIYYVAIVVT